VKTYKAGESLYDPGDISQDALMTSYGGNVLVRAKAPETLVLVFPIKGARGLLWKLSLLPQHLSFL